MDTYSMKVGDICEMLKFLSLSEKYILFKKLQTEMRNQESILIRLYQDANNLERVKNLLVIKKECAIEEIVALLPFVKPENVDAKIMYLRILPVVFSYVSLYDLKIIEAQRIVEMIQMHPIFVSDQFLFRQWFVLFNRRKEMKNRFTYKDEACARGLPELEFTFQSDLTRCVGYANVSLLRAFHRWLRLHRLHKYLFFFANLSYVEIMGINDSNIDFYEEKINLHKITVGAKNKILREIESLRGRKKCLEEIIRTPYRNYSSVEAEIRAIKKILRSPINIDDTFGENIPSLLMRAFKKVFNTVYEQVGTNETIIPTYGLLISILKEAWNYSIFRAEEKACFNEWRKQLTDKINIKNKLKMTSLRSLKDSVDNLNFDGLSLQEHSSGNTTYYQCLEDVATGCVNYVFQ